MDKEIKYHGGDPIVVLTDDEIKKIEELAAYLNCEQIADYMGFSHVTFQAIRKRQPEAAFAYKKGKSAKIRDYADKLEKKAMGLHDHGDTTALIFFLKTQAKWKEDKEPEESKIVHLSADPIKDKAEAIVLEKHKKEVDDTYKELTNALEQ